MKITSRFLGGLLGVVLLLGVGIPAYSQEAAPVIPNIEAPATPSAEVQTQVPDKFDGKVLYKAAFEAIRDLSKALADPATRAAWIAEWENKYANTTQLDTEEGTDKAIHAMSDSLNMLHDGYLDKKGAEELQQGQASNLKGIGAQLTVRNVEKALKALPETATEAEIAAAKLIRPGFELVVQRPIPGSPAAKVLLKGDEIVAVDGAPVNGKTIDAVVATIKGPAGTTVSLTIKRDGQLLPDPVVIKRADVHVPVVETFDMGNGIVRIKLDNFVSDSSVQEFANALMQARQYKKGVIIDLRGNPGGNVAYVLSMASMLMPEGTVLVQENRNKDGAGTIDDHTIFGNGYVMHIQLKEGAQPQIAINPRPETILPADMPLVVLIDGGSASASEILSGALQHIGRAEIYGQPSFGKGVGQTVVPLPYGRFIKVTSFEFLAGGERMDRVGIIPDVEVEQADDDGATDNQLTAATKRVGELIAAKEAREKRAEELRKKHDDFVQKMLELKRKRNNP
jgi:carboxyl-terminal processing protease